MAMYEMEKERIIFKERLDEINSDDWIDTIR